MNKNCEIRKLEERSNFFSPRPYENQINMKKMVLVEVVVDVDGEEDKEEVEVIVNNTSMEAKRDLETSTR